MPSRNPRPTPTGALRIGELARTIGVSRDTIRYYERRGLLTGVVRGSNGYRLYPAAAVARVHLIRRAMDIGFSVEDLGEILGERDRGGVPCRRVRALAQDKLEALDAQLARLTTLRNELDRILRAWDAQLDATPPNQRARLLDMLSAPTTPSSGPHPLKRFNERKSR
jgi:DNA-binding transcriptional MerR regulator